MTLIKPQNQFITIEKHLKQLNIYSNCIQNNINGFYVVSKALNTKKAKDSNAFRGRQQELKNQLKIVNSSIEFYSIKTA